MKKAAVIAITITLLLTGCGARGVHIGPVELPEKQEGNIIEAPDGLTSLKNLYLKYQDGGEIKTAQLQFEPKGIIRGKTSPMIPLASSGSQLEVLGITTDVSISGVKAQLSYNQHTLSLEAKNPNMFKDYDDSIGLEDFPYYQNGTLYAPLLPLLDALNIEYEINGENLTIGGTYTDDSKTGSQR